MYAIILHIIADIFYIFNSITMNTVFLSNLYKNSIVEYAV